ncbi:MAG: HAMP domain-containing histidine kinase [Deltaproteobacteria bacterium]|nr:HAMP domain-containing histidine kinase [Deltaproteobacteria bacterium]
MSDPARGPATDDPATGRAPRVAVITPDGAYGARLVDALADRGVVAECLAPPPRATGDAAAVLVVDLAEVAAIAAAAPGASLVVRAPATATAVERARAIDDGAEACVATAVEPIEVAAIVLAILRRRAAAVHATRSRERFLSVLAHDLRGPLQAVTLGTSMVAQNPALGDADRRVLGRIENGARRMARLIDQVSMLAKVHANPVTLARASVDLVGLLAGLTHDAIQRDGTRSIELRGPASLRGDWDGPRLAQVFDILLTNALTRRDAVVTITIASDGDGEGDATVIVHHTGAPLDPAALATLFADPLGAAAAPAAPSLGLFLVDQIIRAHGGTVSADPGEQGTSFAVRLPAHAAP